MKLEVGMYCRYKNFQNKIKIAKIKGIQKADEVFQYDYINFDNDDGELETNIIKASYNIIDILEENDYINGLRIEKNKYGELYTSYVYYGGDIGKQCEVYTTWLKELKEDMIYSVVTHEQMEQMAYKVGK